MRHLHPMAMLFFILLLGLCFYNLREANKHMAEKAIKLAANTADGCASLKSGGFCISKAKPFIGGNEFFYGKVCAGMESIVGQSSVVDFGSAFGQYGICLTRNFESLNYLDPESKSAFTVKMTQEMQGAGLYGKPPVVTSWQGYDGAEGVEEITGGFVKYLDLSVPFTLEKKFDWVISTEVGEHIPKEYEQTYLDNVVSHACRGVILSWAVEGQGGHHHVNCRNNDYIIANMEKRNLQHDKQSEDKLRENAQDYFKNTLMVFTRQPNNVC